MRRFPALERLGTLFRSEIPFVQQTQATDCGAACLTMVLGYFGRHVYIEEVRNVLAVGRDGVSALAIIDAAASFDLSGRGVRIDVDDLDELDPGTILHWDLAHFVVFDRVEGDAVFVLDPAVGRRRIGHEEVSKSFSGVALLLEPSDSFVKQAKPTNPVWSFVRRALSSSHELRRLIVVSLLIQALGAVLPILNGRIVDLVIPRGDHHLLFVMSVGLAGIIFFQFFTTVVRSQLLVNLRTRIDARMTLGFLDHMLALPFSFFHRRSAGDLALRVQSNETIREAMTSSVLSSAFDGTLVLSYTALLFWASPLMAGVALLLAMLQLVLFVASRRRLKDLITDSHHKKGLAQDALLEILAGVETLKSMGAEQRAAQRWASAHVDVLNVDLKRGRIVAWADGLTGTVRTASPFVILVVGTLEVLAGKLTLGQMLATTSLATAFVLPVSNLVNNMGQFQLIGTLLERLNDVLLQSREQESGKRPAPALSGSLTMRELSFRYAERAPWAVRGVSFEILPGQIVALVGRSGSGKSTLASLLYGLYSPTDGSVEYDGINLWSMDLRTVRRQLGTVVQKAEIFGASVRSNITMGDSSIPLDVVRRAAKVACIDHEIMALPMGYDTVLTGGGGGISGGQKQRIALARAIVRNPKILILDEATSALDAITEHEVHDKLASLGCTRIVIAHRLSTVKRADVILVMENGALVEAGSHDDLIAYGGAYAELVEAQSGALEGVTRRTAVVARIEDDDKNSIPELTVVTPRSE